MNWRAAVLKYAAQMLEDIGMREEAATIRDIRVPFFDGGGVKAGSLQKDGRVTLLASDWQDTRHAIQNASEHVQPGDVALVMAFVVRLPATIVTKAEVEGYQLPGWLADERAAEQGTK